MNESVLVGAMARLQKSIEKNTLEQQKKNDILGELLVQTMIQNELLKGNQNSIVEQSVRQKVKGIKG